MHDGHVGGPEQYNDFPLENIFYFYANIFYCFSPPAWPPCTHSIGYNFIDFLAYDLFYIQQHNIKKIRNNLHKSNETGKPRCLTINGKQITWKQWRSTFEWDQQSFSLPLHEKLTPQHIDLDSAAIMRNKLAEDVLDNKMLFLMQVNL